MDLRIDDRGKYFTPRITKDSIAVVIRTSEHIIVGHIYVQPDQRLKDEMNLNTERFLAITDASVYNAQGDTLLFESGFLIVASAQVIFIAPVDSIKQDKKPSWLPSAPTEESS